MELCRNCPVPASCAIRGKCITDLAPVPDPRLSITADEFAAMARDAERYRWLREKGACNEKSSRGALLSRDRLRVLVAFRYWVAPEELDAAIDAAMAERNK